MLPTSMKQTNWTCSIRAAQILHPSGWYLQSSREARQAALPQEPFFNKPLQGPLPQGPFFYKPLMGPLPQVGMHNNQPCRERLCPKRLCLVHCLRPAQSHNWQGTLKLACVPDWPVQAALHYDWHRPASLPQHACTLQNKHHAWKYAHTHMHKHIHTHIQMRTHTYTRTYTRANTHIHTHIRAHTRAHT